LPRGCSEGKRDRNKRPQPGVQKEDVKGGKKRETKKHERRTRGKRERMRNIQGRRALWGCVEKSSGRNVKF
jgi:hypothetical protein